jgi:hypothetical protein
VETENRARRLPERQAFGNQRNLQWGSRGAFVSLDRQVCDAVKQIGPAKVKQEIAQLSKCRAGFDLYSKRNIDLVPRAAAIGREFGSRKAGGLREVGEPGEIHSLRRDGIGRKADRRPIIDFSFRLLYRELCFFEFLNAGCQDVLARVQILQSAKHRALDGLVADGAGDDNRRNDRQDFLTGFHGDGDLSTSSTSNSIR